MKRGKGNAGGREGGAAWLAPAPEGSDQTSLPKASLSPGRVGLSLGLLGPERRVGASRVPEGASLLHWRCLLLLLRYSLALQIKSQEIQDSPSKKSCPCCLVRWFVRL